MSLREGLQNLTFANRGFNDTAARHNRNFSNFNLPALAKAIDTIDAIAKPQKPSDSHIRDWEAYIAGRTEQVSSRVMRNLSWYPKIAVENRFWNLMVNSERTRNSAKSIQGLVYSFHSRWADVQHLPQFLGLREAIMTYSGPNGVLKKWQENLPLLLFADSVTRLAEEFLKKKMPLEHSIADFRLFEDTQFFREVVSECAQSCANKLDNPATLDYFVYQILGWDKHEIGAFKKHVNGAVMSKAFDDSSDVKARLVDYVVSDVNRLGDPRLRPASWIGMEDSKKKVLQQLTREDIVFFFKKVMTNDRHKRADFWLRYVRSNTPVSRPLLTDTDRYRLNSELRDGSKHFGKKDGSQSAFILDFGRALVVEFNEVGKVYIFNSSEKRRFLPDIFRTKRFTDGELKRFEVYSKAHQGNWQPVVEQALAQNGIRP